MSNVPPGQSDGWYDPNGHLQPGFPPAGYWQASDGRWYPPELSSQDTQFVNPNPGTAPQGPPTFQPPSAGQPPGGQYVPPSEPPNAGGYQQPYQQGPPQQQPFAQTPGPQYQTPPGQAPQVQGYSAPPGFAPPASQQKSRAGLYVLVGLLAVAMVGCTAIGITAFARSGDDDTVSAGTSTTSEEADSGSTTTASDTTDTTVADTTTSAQGLSGVVPSGEETCSVVDETAILVEVVNETSEVQNFFLTVAFFDGDTRLGDTSAFINNLRPGERTIEESFIFDQEGSRCEIIESDSFPVEQVPDHFDDLTPCSITGTDIFGDIEAELSATNSSSVSSDYSIQVAFIDPDGIRRGTGFASIESVRPGENAPTDVFTTVDGGGDLVCEVVGVDRFDS